MWPELSSIERGELQQWHIIAAPHHPFLYQVILAVIQNILTYDPKQTGVGQPGVLRTTGPIAYTKAIAAMLPSKLNGTRWLTSEAEIGLQYSIVGGDRNKGDYKRGYRHLPDPVVKIPAWKFLLYSGFFLRKVLGYYKRRFRHALERA